MSTCDRCKHGPSQIVEGFHVEQEPSLFAYEEEAQIFASSGTICEKYDLEQPLELIGNEITPDSCPCFEDKGNPLVRCARCGELTPISCHSLNDAGESICAHCLKGDVWCLTQCNGDAERLQCAHWVWLHHEAMKISDAASPWREKPAVETPEGMLFSPISNDQSDERGAVEGFGTISKDKKIDVALGILMNMEEQRPHDGPDVHTHNRRSVGFVALGNYDLALADLERAIALNPDYAPSYFNRGNIYASIGDFEQALVDYNRAIQLDESDAHYYLHRGRVNAELQHFAVAVENYERVIELDPMLVEAYFWMGVAHFELGEYEKAVVDYTTLLEYVPNMIEAHLSRGRTYVALDEYQQALADYDKVIDLDPHNIAGYDQRAQVFALLSLFDRALDDFSSALELNPDSALIYAHRGRIYASMNKFDEAIDDLTRATELDPYSPEPYLWQAGVYMSLHRLPQAIAVLNRAAEIAPDYALVYARRGDAYLAMDTKRRALTDYTRAITLDPTLDEAYHHRGIAHSLLDHYEKALEDLSRAVELTDPEDPWLYFTRGNVYAEMGKFNAAIADYTRAIKLYPAISNFYTGRGNIYAELQKYQLSLADLTLAIELETNNARNYAARGAVYAEMGKYTLALADYNKAVELDSESEDILNNRARVLVLMHRYAQAIEDFNRAIELNEYYLEAYYRRGEVYHEDLRNLYRFNLPITYQFDISAKERERWLTLSQADEQQLPQSSEGVLHIVREKYLQTLIERYDLADIVSEIIWISAADAALADLGEIALFSIWDIETNKAKIFFHCAVQDYMESSWYQIADFSISHERFLIRKLAAVAKSDVSRRVLATYVRGRARDWERYAYLHNLQPDNLFALGISPDTQLVCRAWNELILSVVDSEIGREQMEEILKSYRSIYGLGTYERLFLNTPRLLELRIHDMEQEEYYDAESVDVQTAVQQFTERIELDPYSAQNYERRGLFYLLFTDNYEAALVDFSHAIELDPNNSSYYYHRGTAFFLCDEYAAAVADFDRVLAEMPEQAGVHARRGEAHLELGNSQSAIIDFTKAIELDAGVADYYLGRANAYTNEKEYEDALSDFTMGIELDPEQTEAYFQRHVIYKQLGRPLDALADLEEVFDIHGDLDYLDIAPDLPILYYYRAHRKVYIEKDYYAALDDLSQALNLYPEYDDAYHLRSHCYTELEDYEAAIADLKRALEINPDNPNHYNCLAYIYADLLKTNLEEATELAWQAVDAEPDNAHFLDTLGWIYYLRGMWAEAYDILSQSAAALPDNTEVQKHWHAVQLRLQGHEEIKKGGRSSVITTDPYMQMSGKGE